MKEPVVERRGKTLTPGERFLNWCKGVVMVWPIILPLLGGAVYGNSQTVRNFIHGEPVPTADEVQPIGAAGFEDRVIASIDSILEKLKSIDARIDQIESSSISYDGDLKSQLERLRAEVKAWHE